MQSSCYGPCDTPPPHPPSPRVHGLCFLLQECGLGVMCCRVRPCLRKTKRKTFQHAHHARKILPRFPSPLFCAQSSRTPSPRNNKAHGLTSLQRCVNRCRALCTAMLGRRPWFDSTRDSSFGVGGPTDHPWARSTTINVLSFDGFDRGKKHKPRPRLPCYFSCCGGGGCRERGEGIEQP